MRLVALLPVRNEEYCLGLTLRALLMWVDAVVVLLHACTDDSADIVEAVIREHDKGRVIVLQMSGDWLEMEHRQYMLHKAREAGATHIVTLDADELLCGALIKWTAHEDCAKTQPIRTVVETVSQSSILQLPGYNLRNGTAQYHSSGIWGRRWFSCAFQDDARLRWAGDRFHHREPMGPHLNPYRPIAQGEGGVMHLWGASERRLKARHAYYKLTERLRWPDKPMREIDQVYSWAIHGRPDARDTPATWTYADVPAAWWEPYAHLMKYLHLDAEPWQEAEVRRLIDQHGKERFAGLDLFGVV
jgi:hypothetical protein